MRYGNQHFQSVQRSGVTLVEVMVVIGVISLLAAISLPAIQQSRAVLRSVQCRSHLHQLGIAFAAYQSDYGVYPVDLLPFRGLLPYLGHVNEQRLLDEMPTTRLVPSLNVVEYTCPADPQAQPGRGHVSYLLNEGWGWQRNGMNGIRQKLGYPYQFPGPKDILDGLSNTAGLSERMIQPSESTASQTVAEPIRYSWFIPAGLRGSAQLDAFVDACRNSRTVALLYPSTHNGMIQTYHGYDHTLTPNRPGCLNAKNTDPPWLYPEWLNIYPASSQHHGGVNLMLLDGSVRFVTNHIDEIIWRAAGTRAGSETVELP